MEIRILDHPTRDHFKLIAIDGHTNLNAYVCGGDAVLYDQIFYDLFSNLPLERLQTLFPAVDVHVFDDKYLELIKLDFFENFSGFGSPDLVFFLSLNAETWNSPWSMRQFVDTLYGVCREHGEMNVYCGENRDFLEGFSIVFHSIDVKQNLYNAVSESRKKYNLILEQTFRDLEGEFNSDCLIRYFDFPVETRTACQQYLIYFGQFLEDLGIRSETRLESNGREVLFTVKPVDNFDALSKIKDALELYLRLPSAIQEYSNEMNFSNIAVLQLKANIAHLNSQLMLASATIQLKEATIRSLETSATLVKFPTQNKNEEQLLDGLVTIKDYERGGIRVNLPELFRRLKRVFRV